ncbi:hypothetical protein JVU11DRAFT_3153 [Chiua virens]|nr:hypothetical protein JVU11DRAFT_3153 [Chiua virens]
MKRALVEYPSDDDDDEQANVLPTQKKRKLPALSASLTVPTPVDNPALHQGRVRTAPHVEGQYATHIYVSLVLNPKDALYTLIEDALALAKTHVPSLHPIGDQGAPRELHVSLSRPLYLRAHQRDEFKGAIKQVASSIAPFDASFTSFLELTNDERTRTFLAMDVGAGRQELCRCLGLLGPTLRLLRQREFYVDPKFHASIAWALLEKSTPSSSDIAAPSIAGELDEITVSECDVPEERHTPSSRIEQPPIHFHRIPQFPPALVSLLNEAYAARLSQARTGGFVVDKISVKIGKDVFTWPFSGM